MTTTTQTAAPTIRDAVKFAIVFYGEQDWQTWARIWLAGNRKHDDFARKVEERAFSACQMHHVRAGEIGEMVGALPFEAEQRYNEAVANLAGQLVRNGTSVYCKTGSELCDEYLRSDIRRVIERQEKAQEFLQGHNWGL